MKKDELKIEDPSIFNDEYLKVTTPYDVWYYSPVKWNYAHEKTVCAIRGCSKALVLRLTGDNDFNFWYGEPLISMAWGSNKKPVDVAFISKEEFDSIIDTSIVKLKNWQNVEGL